jgi:hypothetical protein
MNRPPQRTRARRRALPNATAIGRTACALSLMFAACGDGETRSGRGDPGTGKLAEGGEVTKTPPRIDLKVLVFSDGEVGTKMAIEGLKRNLVPFKEIDMTEEGRTAIKASDLADGELHAKYQAVVVPSEYSEKFKTGELATIRDFEKTFNIRQLNAAQAWPGPDNGLEVGYGPDPVIPSSRKGAQISRETARR